MASFYSLTPGTPVEDRFGRPVGEVKQELIAGDYFDGLIVGTPVGDRFVDAPEVRRITDDEVQLAVTVADVEHPGPKQGGIHGVRRGRREATVDDIDAVTRLKVAFVDDRLTVEDLERRVEAAHQAELLTELDRLVEDI